MLTDDEIEAAKTRVKYSLPQGGHHEHNDCIRMAYEWLDAQTKTRAPNTRLRYPLKHLIQSWSLRYVSRTDVDVAAEMHPHICGTYPHFNISSRLVWPNPRRLKDISEAGKHESTYGSRRRNSAYGKREEL